jgi:hypothetical protein
MVLDNILTGIVGQISDILSDIGKWAINKLIDEASKQPDLEAKPYDEIVGGNFWVPGIDPLDLDSYTKAAEKFWEIAGDCGRRCRKKTPGGDLVLLPISIMP